MKTKNQLILLVIFTAFLYLLNIQNIYAQSGFITHKKDSLMHQKVAEYHTGYSKLVKVSDKPDQLQLKTVPWLSVKLLKQTLAEQWLQYTVDSQWNTDSKKFTPLGRTYFAYDGNDNQVDVLGQTNSSSGWYNYFRYLYTFDSTNNIKDETDLVWNGKSWDNVYLVQYSYNSTNQQILELIKEWYNSDWYDYYRIQKTYYGEGPVHEELHQYWDGTQWINYYKIDYTYDSMENNTEAVMQIWEYGQWFNYVRSQYKYDGNKNMTEETDQGWDGVTWQNVYKYEYNFNTDKWSDWMIYYWNSANWDNLEQVLFEYDGSNNNTLITYKVWDGAQWLNYYQYKMAYDGNGNNTQTVELAWLNNNWTNYWQTDSYYSATRPISVPTPIEQTGDNLPAKISLYQNYPNPFNPATQIKYELPAAGNVQLRIYDITGRLVSTLINEFEPAGLHMITFQGKHLSSGVYIYQLTVGSKVVTKKMLYLK